jgi:hypothetical protein
MTKNVMSLFFSYVTAPHTSFFSGGNLFSGAVACGGTTAPEFQNSSKRENFYIFQILSPSSIRFSKRFFKITKDTTWI